MKKFLFLFLALLFLVVFPLFSVLVEMPWESGLEAIMTALGGPTAKIIGGILIIAGGLAVAATEGAAVKKLLWVVIGVGIALNATSLLTNLFRNQGATGIIITDAIINALP